MQGGQNTVLENRLEKQQHAFLEEGCVQVTKVV